MITHIPRSEIRIFGFTESEILMLDLDFSGIEPISDPKFEI